MEMKEVIKVCLGAQFVGLLLVGIVSTILPKLTNFPKEKWALRIIFLVGLLTIGLSCLGLIMEPDIIPWIIPWIFLIDALALSLLIYYSGGARESMYSPVLLLLPFMGIILGEVGKTFWIILDRVLVYTVVTASTYLFFLSRYYDQDFRIDSGKKWLKLNYNFWYACVSTACLLIGMMCALWLSK